MFRQGRASASPGVVKFCTAAAQRMDSLLHPRSLPITAVQQYAGMSEVQPLIQPRMWNTLDVAPAVTAAAKPAAAESLPSAASGPAVIAPVVTTSKLPPSAPPPPASKNKAPINTTKSKTASAAAQKPKVPAKSEVAVAATQARAGTVKAKSGGSAPLATSAMSAPAFPSMDECSSDSEGSMPDIDSGDE